MSEDGPEGEAQGQGVETTKGARVSLRQTSLSRVPQDELAARSEAYLDGAIDAYGTVANDDLRM